MKWKENDKEKKTNTNLTTHSIKLNYNAKHNIQNENAILLFYSPIWLARTHRNISKLILRFGRNHLEKTMGHKSRTA